MGSVKLGFAAPRADVGGTDPPETGGCGTEPGGTEAVCAALADAGALELGRVDVDDVGPCGLALACSLFPGRKLRLTKRGGAERLLLGGPDGAADGALGTRDNGGTLVPPWETLGGTELGAPSVESADGAWDGGADEVGGSAWLASGDEGAGSNGMGGFDEASGMARRMSADDGRETGGGWLLTSVGLSPGGGAVGKPDGETTSCSPDSCARGP